MVAQFSANISSFCYVLGCVTMKERNALKNKEYVAYSAEILVNVLIFIYVYIQ